MSISDMILLSSNLSPEAAEKLLNRNVLHRFDNSDGSDQLGVTNTFLNVIEELTSEQKKSFRNDLFWVDKIIIKTISPKHSYCLVRFTSKLEVQISEELKVKRTADKAFYLRDSMFSDFLPAQMLKSKN